MKELVYTTRPTVSELVKAVSEAGYPVTVKWADKESVFTTERQITESIANNICYRISQGLGLVESRKGGNHAPRKASTLSVAIAGTLAVFHLPGGCVTSFDKVTELWNVPAITARTCGQLMVGLMADPREAVKNATEVNFADLTPITRSWEWLDFTSTKATQDEAIDDISAQVVATRNKAMIKKLGDLMDGKGLKVMGVGSKNEWLS